MAFWLVKTEPDVFSFQELQQKGTAMWDGVRNYQARNNLRGMRTGDLVLVYHSREGLEIVGLARVVREAYPDPTADKGDWSAVDLQALKPLGQSLSLAFLKSDTRFQDMLLVRNSRLSVMPLTEVEFQTIMSLSGTQLDPDI